MNELWSAFDLAEAFHLAHALAVLHDQGIHEMLIQPQTVEQIATQYGLDRNILRALLQYLAARTELIKQCGDEFCITERYDLAACFLFDQYLGAFAPNVDQLSALLLDSSRASALVNRHKQAKAFARLTNPSVPALPEIILQLDLTHLLDLGCGTGTLLLALAQRNPAFVGWGIDANPEMCAIAREQVRVAGMEKRISIFEGDCADLSSAIPVHIRDQVTTVTATSLLNEFFGNGDPSTAIAWLCQLSALLPERALLIADYYGRLGKPDLIAPHRTLLHDFVQVISGQGVPPKDREAWADIYEAVGCKLIHIVEDDDATYFIHILRL